MKKLNREQKADELPIIQKAYNLILWYIPILNRLPRDQKFALGDRIVSGLYGLHEGLILARYDKERIGRLEMLNGALDVLRHQTRPVSATPISVFASRPHGGSLNASGRVSSTRFVVTLIERFTLR